MQDLKTSSLTIRLDPDLGRQVTKAAKRAGLSRSAIVRNAVRRQLSLVQLQNLRRRIVPLAEARGYLTEEDVFREVS
ncbi:MAG: CopG family transcriptional regulator [Steroidobacteraceae bacterium]